MQNGIIRLYIEHADFEEEGGLFHRMHMAVWITVGSNPTYKTGLAEDSGHKCEFKDKHVDIDTRFGGFMMKIQGVDLEKEDGVPKATIVGEVDIGVAAFAAPCEKDVELFHPGKHGNLKKAGHIHIRSEFIPIPEPPHPVPRKEEHFELKHALPSWEHGHLKIHPIEAHITHDTEPGRADRMDPFIHIQCGNDADWRSTLCVDGNRNPRWEHQHMEVSVHRMQEEMHIEVRDKDLFGSEPIGSACIKLGFLAREEGMFDDWIELTFKGGWC